MLRIYSVEELKRIIAGVHVNVSKIMSLADYCKAVIVGCDRFKKINGLESSDMNEVEVFIEEAKNEALAIYKSVEEKVSNVEAVDGKVGRVVSSPIGMASGLIEGDIAHAESGSQLLEYAENARMAVNNMVKEIMESAEAIDVKSFNPNYVQDVSSCVEGILENTQKALAGIRQQTETVVRKEIVEFDWHDPER